MTEICTIIQEKYQIKDEIIMVSNQIEPFEPGQKSESVNHLRTGVICESVDPLQHGHTLALVLADGSERVEKTAGHHLPETHRSKIKNISPLNDLAKTSGFEITKKKKASYTRISYISHCIMGYSILNML